MLCTLQLYLPAVHGRNRLLILPVLLVLCSCALLAYSSLRAYRLSFTHDESLSYRIVLGELFWKDTANHHPLNTKLMGWTSRWLGSREWQLRLPNVIAHILYLVFGLLLLRQLTETTIRDPRLGELMPRVEMVTGSAWDDPTLRRIAPEGARVYVALRDGSAIEGFCSMPRGSAAPIRLRPRSAPRRQSWPCRYFPRGPPKSPIRCSRRRRPRLSAQQPKLQAQFLRRATT